MILSSTLLVAEADCNSTPFDQQFEDATVKCHFREVDWLESSTEVQMSEATIMMVMGEMSLVRSMWSIYVQNKRFKMVPLTSWDRQVLIKPGAEDPLQNVLFQILINRTFNIAVKTIRYKYMFDWLTAFRAFNHFVRCQSWITYILWQWRQRHNEDIFEHLYHLSIFRWQASAGFQGLWHETILLLWW